MIPRRLAICGLIIGALFGAACSAPVDISVASAAGSTFHGRFNQKNYSEIFAAADPKFRAAVKQEDLVTLLARVHDKLGDVTDATRTGFFVNYKFGASTVTISYTTKFQSVEAHEQFVWAKTDGGLRLLNYNIKSEGLDPTVQ
jgi:hypothetical protein